MLTRKFNHEFVKSVPRGWRVVDPCFTTPWECIIAPTWCAWFFRVIRWRGYRSWLYRAGLYTTTPGDKWEAGHWMWPWSLDARIQRENFLWRKDLWRRGLHRLWRS